MTGGFFDWAPILSRIDLLPDNQSALDEVALILDAMVNASPVECEIPLKTISKKTKTPIKTLRQDLSFRRKKSKKKEKSDDDIDWLEVISGDIRDSIVEQFGDFTGDAWVYYDDDDGRRFYSANSVVFEDFVRTRVQAAMGKPVENWVKPIARLVASESRRAGVRDLGVRWIIDENGDWVYQLTQNDNLIVTNQGFDILESKPVFRHYNEQKPVVVDLNASLEDIDLLDQFFNFRDANDYQLFKVILPAFLVPEIAKPVMMFTGPPGSAKSTACRLIKMLLDPVSGMEYGGEFITKSDQLFVTCLRNQVIISDNVQDPTAAQQDMMSRLTTGLNINARKLYTNDEMVSATFRRIQLVNGIQFTNLQADLIDRTLIWELDRVDDEQRSFESELFAKFEKLAPRIRGALFKAVFQMRNQKVTRVPEMRLVDFARYAVRSGIVFGLEEETVQQFLTDKVNLQKDEALDASMVAIVLLSWLKDRSEWENTPTELYQELTKYVTDTGQHNIGAIVKPKDWYPAPNLMTKDLRLIAHNLRYRGWTMTDTRNTARRMIRFEKHVLLSPSERLVQEAKEFDEIKAEVKEVVKVGATVKVEDIYAVVGVHAKRVVEKMLENGDLHEIRADEVMRLG